MNIKTLDDNGPDTDAGDEPSVPPPVEPTESDKTYREQRCIGCANLFYPDAPYRGYYCEDCRDRI